MSHIYLVFIILFKCLCYANSDLGLNEGDSCTTKGINGTCVNIFKCTSAALSSLYFNAGFNHSSIPELPEICSHTSAEPIVCCTDCVFDDEKLVKSHAVGPLGVFESKDGPKAWNKCLEYFQKLPYPCRGYGRVEIEKDWNEDKMCHEFSLKIALPVGGREAKRWEFPHMALLGYGPDEDSAKWLCGGSVISERYILTAAHCSSAAEVGPIRYAALGILKRTEPKLSNIYKIKRIIMHPEYKSPSKYHDIALLETEIEINFGKNLLPACLDTGKELDTMVAEASGWGRLGYKKELAETLEVVKLVQYTEDECANMYVPHRHLKAGYNHITQMCYGNYSTIVDTCEGDSGGPLQIDNDKCLYTILGVTSYGKDCGILGSAGMYTRVRHYVPWIESIVWPEDSI